MDTTAILSRFAALINSIVPDMTCILVIGSADQWSPHSTIGNNQCTLDQGLTLLRDPRIQAIIHIDPRYAGWDLIELPVEDLVPGTQRNHTCFHVQARLAFDQGVADLLPTSPCNWIVFQFHGVNDYSAPLEFHKHPRLVANFPMGCGWPEHVTSNVCDLVLAILDNGACRDTTQSAEEMDRLLNKLTTGKALYPNPEIDRFHSRILTEAINGYAFLNADVSEDMKMVLFLHCVRNLPASSPYRKNLDAAMTRLMEQGDTPDWKSLGAAVSALKRFILSLPTLSSLSS